VLQAHRELLGLMVLTVLQELKVLQAHKELPVLTVLQELKVL
jgi:hypothetical protein